MHVKELTFQGFMSLKGGSVTFPDAGVVVVTGTNGEGKSALIEAVSMVGWGETLRGTDPWAGPEGGLKAVLDDGDGEDLIVEVERHKSKDKLTFHRKGETPAKYTTPTKAREALTEVLGSWEVWRRASAFSTSDVAHYSLATDADQKRLVEGLLGLDVFDPALKACRAELAIAVNDQTRYSSMVEGKKALIAEKRKHAEQWSAVAGSSGTAKDVTALRERKATLQAAAAKAREDISKLRVSLSAQDQEMGTLAALVSSIRSTLDRVQADKCPTCTQAIPSSLRDRLSREALQADERRKAKAAEVNKVKASLSEELEELQSEMDSVQVKVRDLDSEIATVVADANRAAIAKRNQDEANEAVRKLQSELADAEDKLDDASYRVSHLKAAEVVLGLRGVRSHVLARALTGLDSVANAWLARIAGPGLRIKIQAFTETKTAGVSDKFSLVVEGAGGGKGYKAASQGQRRRIDVALLFALSEVAAAARGARPGTLFVDEVFDILDEAGVAAVSAAIREFSQSRCVVVITHSPTLAKSLMPVRRWHVAQGVVQEV